MSMQRQIAQMMRTAGGGGEPEIPAGLVGYWKGDETSGTDVLDYSGNDLTLTGTPTFHSPGVSGVVSRSYADCGGEDSPLRVPYFTVCQMMRENVAHVGEHIQTRLGHHTNASRVATADVVSTNDPNFRNTSRLYTVQSTLVSGTASTKTAAVTDWVFTSFSFDGTTVLWQCDDTIETLVLGGLEQSRVAAIDFTIDGAKEIWTNFMHFNRGLSQNEIDTVRSIITP